MDVHACVEIIFIFMEHLGNFYFGEAHIHLEVSRDIPRAVHLVVFLRTQFSFEISHIMDTGKNH